MENFKEFLYTTAIVDEDLVEAMISSEPDKHEVIVQKQTLVEIIEQNWESYSFTEIFNTWGIDILGKEKAKRFKELSCHWDYTRVDELKAFKEIIINAFEENNCDCIPTCNGLLINFHGYDIDFEPDNEEYLNWKYSNYDEFFKDESIEELILSDEFIKMKIN